MGQNTKKFSAEVRVPLQAQGYEISKGLGKGAFGEVFLATKKGQSFAVKAIDKQMVKKRPFLQKYIKQEMEIMNALNHSNIVKQETVIETKSFYFMVLEYCDLGNLMSYQAKLPNKRYPLKEACQILMDVIKGLKVIHQNGYIHRDIKSENVLIKTTEKGRIFKIADFGFARPVETVISTYCGTEKYMAPEILDNKPYTRSVDLWALGVLFYFMLFAEYPFGGMDIKSDLSKKCSKGFNVKQVITKAEKLTDVNSDVENFFKNIFEIDSKKRLTFARLLSHPLFAQSHCRESRRFYELNESSEKLVNELLQIQKNEKKEDETSTVDEPAADLIVEEVPITNDNKSYSKEILSTSFEVSKIIYLRECANQLYAQSSFNRVDRLCFRYYVLRAFMFYSKKLLKELEEGQMPTEFKDYKLEKWTNFASSPEIKTLIERLKEELLKGQLDFTDTYSCLKDVQSSIKIKNFIDKFTESGDDKDFQSFKIPYRSTVSFFFKLLHQNKSIDSHTKNKLKLKLFCCHMINRIFNQNQLPNNFEYFVKWLSTHHKGENTLNFSRFRQWVLCETKENLDKNISHLHQTFFSK